MTADSITDMSRMVTYFTFNGNCRAAMEFYQNCLGGHLQLQTVGELPAADALPLPMQAYIVQASLRKGNMVLMGTDMVEGRLIQGNSVSVLLECSSEAEMRTYYEKLVADGEASCPIGPTFWGSLFGGLTDKYGHRWLFHYRP